MKKTNWRSQLSPTLVRFLTSVASQGLLSLVQDLEENHVPHGEYLRVKRLLLASAALAPEGTIIVLTGPGRTGKSRVADALASELVEEDSSSNLIPFIAAEAVAGQARDQLKYLNLRLLAACKHPVYSISSLTEGYRPRISAAEPILRLALEDSIRDRQVKFANVDEAHHLVQTDSDKLAGKNVDSLKSLANNTGIVLTLICGYPMITRGNLSAHFSGRMLLIHFSRYHLEKAAEAEAFAAGIECLSRKLPFRGGGLLDHLDLLGPGSLGCFGHVMTWTYAALAQMVATKSRFLRREHFEATRFLVQLEENERDIEAGEAAAKRFIDATESTSKRKTSPKRQRRSKAFRRSPRRLPIGKDA